jgi:RNA polymerase sigma factor (sigma-70 family)
MTIESVESLWDRPDAFLLRATTADPSAFGVFYRRYAERVLAYLHARTRDGELAADLTAEVFAAVLRAADSFDPTRAAGESAAAWLFAIAHNTLMRSLRRGRVAEEARRQLGMLTPLVLDDEELERVEALASLDTTLSELLDSLPADQREAIVARVLDERDYGEIATELRCSSLVVRKRVSRGLSTLRAQIEET